MAERLPCYKYQATTLCIKADAEHCAHDGGLFIYLQEAYNYTTGSVYDSSNKWEALFIDGNIQTQYYKAASLIYNETISGKARDYVSSISLNCLHVLCRQRHPNARFL